MQGIPSKINTNQNPNYAHIVHKKVKYLNNRIESDHGKLKMLIKTLLGFKNMKSANIPSSLDMFYVYITFCNRAPFYIANILHLKKL